MDKDDGTLFAFGAALRQEREARHLSIEALSAKSGISVAKVTAYEAGEKEVSLLEVCALAKAMGLTTESLFAKAGV